MIKARFIIEAQGKPKKLVENSLKKHIEEVKEIGGLKVYDESWEDTEEMEDHFAALVDIGVEAESFEKFFSGILRAAPTAVVMEEPEKTEVKMSEMQNVVNDFVQLFHLFARANAQIARAAGKMAEKADSNTIRVEVGEEKE